MQRVILFLLCLGFTSFLFAQAPQGFKFQAVARDAANQAYETQNIAVRVSLVRGGPSGTVAYSERHEATTTSLGVFDLHIGNGSALSGTFDGVDWSTDSYWLKIDFDPDGGTDYVNLGASQLLSVPYALYAKESGSGGGGGNPTDELQNLIYDPNTQTLTLTNGNSVTLQLGGGGGGGSQTLAFDPNTNTLTISGGNAIQLPGGIPGPEGPAGPAGPEGPQGPAGPAGPAGQDGTGITLLGTVANVGDLPGSGNNGDLYIVSASGDGYAWDGSNWNNVGPIQGPQGAVGPAGPKGDTGNTGPAGPKGDTGDAGPAGPKGDQGDTGPAGPEGPQGPAGPAGPAGQDGTGITLLGTVANVGDLPGSGNNGDVYIVSSSGDGYAWDGSTWVNVGPIQGPKGDTGDAGPAGPKGDTGDVGPAGPKGDQGDTGPAGPKGDTGNPGPTGPKGDQGDTGPAGPKGDTGDAGPAGPKGDQGDVGPAGPKGDQGDPGPQGPAGPAGGLELPYFDEESLTGASFHVHNPNAAGYGVVGTSGPGGATLPANRAGVFGHATNAHGVYGYSENSFYAGVQGVSNSATGYGVLGYGFGDGIGGYFYTTSGGRAALTTGRGNVGIGTQEPEMKMHVQGDMLVQTNVGNLHLGYPGTGNRWALATIGSGQNMIFRSKPSGSNSYTTRFYFGQDGRFGVGQTNPRGTMHVRNNSTISNPHLILEEIGNDYARLELTNTVANGAYWHVAGLPSATAASARLNFYFRNASGAADRMTLTGDGELGINGTPTARMEIFQRGQAVGLGLRFDDGTANADWDLTHGFGLRFHYGGTLRAVISATNGAYIQGSDRRLKSQVKSMSKVLDRVALLRPTSYFYKSDSTQTTTLGFIAQEVNDVFPELVEYSAADDLYGLNYGGFGVVAIKAIQEQQEVIEAQEARINKQEARIESLETRLARLEKLLEK